MSCNCERVNSSEYAKAIVQSSAFDELIVVSDTRAVRSARNWFSQESTPHYTCDADVTYLECTPHY